MMTRKKSTSKTGQSKKRSESSAKGWVTRRLNEKKSKKKTTRTLKTRNLTSEKLEKHQKTERERNASRRKAQKKGKSLASDKPKLKSRRPVRLARKASKKRVSVR